MKMILILGYIVSLSLFFCAILAAFQQSRLFAWAAIFLGLIELFSHCTFLLSFLEHVLILPIVYAELQVFSAFSFFWEYHE
jgi:hypothetical protein